MFRKAPQHGFAMVVVIGLLAVLGILGTSLLMISTTQQVGSALDVQGVRAYHAARAGLEWGTYHVLRPGFSGCAGINGRSIVFPGDLAGMRSTLACTETVHREEATDITVAAIVATACNDTAACPTAASPPPATYVERQLRITVTR
jgi:MSHA biogenesis protein MshP